MDNFGKASKASKVDQRRSDIDLPRLGHARGRRSNSTCAARAAAAGLGAVALLGLAAGLHPLDGPFDGVAHAAGFEPTPDASKAGPAKGAAPKVATAGGADGGAGSTPTTQDGGKSDGADFASAVRGAVGESNPKPEGGGGGDRVAPGTRSQRPSPGAVTGAINSALGGARACLPGDAPTATASATFAANGTVTSVSVQNASKEATPCIAAALKTMRVAPFVQAPLVVRVTVRP